MFEVWIVRCYFLKFGFKYECIRVIFLLSAVSEKLTSGLFNVQGRVSITEFALIFLTLMPAAVSAGAIRIPNVGIAFGLFSKRLKKLGLNTVL